LDANLVGGRRSHNLVLVALADTTRVRLRDRDGRDQVCGKPMGVGAFATIEVSQSPVSRLDGLCGRA